MTKTFKTKRRRNQSFRANQWQTIALFIMLAISFVLVWLCIFELMFPQEYMMYGEKNYTDWDDVECTYIGSAL